ncbi:MAG: tetratricopeptide repeat protein [Sulfuricurvum sp.]|nr:tetratricopeptide repeat protein [Sulfuricurvum sp.]
MKKTLLSILILFWFGFIGSVYAEDFNDGGYKNSFWKTYTEALRGDKIAEYQVGVIYEHGIGIDKNETQAAKWYEKAAHQGYIDAQYNLAIMYASGRGVSKDEAVAMMWLSLAAKQGDKEARALLLQIIDGKLEEKKPNTNVSEEIETIVPVTFITKEGAIVCSLSSKCSVYKINTTFTSKSKRGKYYKISGIVAKEGWKEFKEDGWIDESSVEIRR